MELIYWKLKGVCEPIRYFLQKCQIKYYENNPDNIKDWIGLQEFFYQHGEIFMDMPALFTEE